MRYTFKSRYEELNRFDTSRFGDKEVKDEPMFFNCTLKYAYENGGPITKAFIRALPVEWTLDRCVFDSRSHMLMPGMFPCIPGWHHDDVIRGANGQPNYRRVFLDESLQSEHIMGLVNGRICPTQIALGEFCLEGPQGDEITYQKWHPIVDRSSKVIKHCGSGVLIYFDWQTFHQGVEAVDSGWRWFGRVSRKTERLQGITNEIRKQVQVYMKDPNHGW